MSVESSQALERSVLERKERDELQAIAEALGVKPGSRARKAEIVDAILRTTGVVDGDTPPEPAPTPARAPRARKSTRGASAAAAAAAAEAAPPEALPLTVPDEGAAGDPSAGGGGDGDGTADPGALAGAAPTEADPLPDPAFTQLPLEQRVEEAAAALPGGDDGLGPAPETLADAPEAERGRGAPTFQAPEQELPVEEPPAAWELEVGDGGVDAVATTDAPEARGEADTGEVGTGEVAEAGAEAGRRDDRRPWQDGEGAEGGGRRRRRRGRDRDRERPDRAPGWQPGGQPQAGAQPGGQPGGERFERAEEGTGEPVEVAGLLDLRDQEYGFLRVRGYLPSKEDVYVSVKQVRQFGLRKGDYLEGLSRPAGRQERNPALLRIDRVNGQDPEAVRNRPKFEDLTPLFPDQKLRLETPGDPLNMTARIIDLVSPIGKGQRGLIVSPPKAGKTTIMKQIARSIETNNPEVHLIVLLVDERPEEVTDMRRWIKGEVVASTFDRPSDEHTLVAELTIERAKRMVEEGRDVVIILDGITRLSRAYNLAAPASGRIMSGGIDAGALYPPKKFFGAARNIEEGGSLTILATALVETNSRMDDAIFEEFKGTGNMELRLDRKLAERRIYPAIDVEASSTRHEELLFARNQLQQVWKLRRVLMGLGEGGSSGAGLELLIDRMKTFQSNDAFLAEVAKAPSIG